VTCHGRELPLWTPSNPPPTFQGRLFLPVISHQHKGMNPQAKPLRHALGQLQEMLVSVIVEKQLTAIDSAIEYVVPTFSGSTQ
jgi:hypothetical protein